MFRVRSALAVVSIGVALGTGPLPAAIAGTEPVREPRVAALESPPRVVIGAFESGLIALMKEADRLGFSGRYQLVAPVIARTYDLPYIARVVLGGSWRALGEGERQQFIDRFTRLVISTFAAEVGRYRGQAFKFDEEKPLRRGSVLIRSRLLDPDGDVDRFDYRLHESPSGWRVVNLSVDGVSDVALKRSEYTSVMREDGFQALLARLDDQIRQYQRVRP